MVLYLTVGSFCLSIFAQKHAQISKNSYNSMQCL